MKTKHWTFVYVLVLAFWPALINAQWSNIPTENTAVSNSVGIITMPHVAMDPSGTSFISWYSATEGFRFDVYLQGFRTNGTKLWAPDGLLVSKHATYSWVSDYGLAVDKKGYAILTFQDIRDGVSNAFAYRISPDGDFSWGPDGIRLTDDPDENWWPQVTVNDENESIFLYSIVPPDSVENWKIGIQKVDSTGNKVWNDNILNDPDKDYYMPQMLPTEHGNLMVSWLAKSSKADTVAGQINFFHVYIQKFNHDGQPMWYTPVQVDSGYHMAYNSVYTVPYLINNGADGAFVVWQSVSIGEPNIRVNNIAPDGQVLWGANGIGVETKPMQQSTSPSAIYNPTEGKLYIFFLLDDKSVNSSTIGGQKFSTTGERLWGEGTKQMVPHIYSADSVYLVSFIRPAPDNRLCLFFEIVHKSKKDSDSITQAELFAGLVDADGNYLWPGDFVPLSTAVGNKTFFTAGDYSSGQWITAWADYRQHPSQNVLSNIYAQNINIKGTLEFLPVKKPVKSEIPVLTCYPNPATDILHIKVNGLQGQKMDAEIKIFSIEGKEILSGKYDESSYGFEIKSLKSGIYIISVASRQYIYKQKLIVR